MHQTLLNFITLISVNFKTLYSIITYWNYKALIDCINRSKRSEAAKISLQ